MKQKTIGRICTIALTASLFASLMPCGIAYAEEKASDTATSGTEETAATEETATTEEAAATEETAGTDETAATESSSSSTSEVTEESEESDSTSASSESASETSSESKSVERVSATEAEEDSSVPTEYAKVSDSGEEYITETEDAGMERLGATGTTQKLDTPAIRWGGSENGYTYAHEVLTVTGVQNCENNYQVELWKDGNEINSEQWDYGTLSATEFAVAMGTHFTDAGTYKLRIKANGNDKTGYSDSDWSAFTEEWTFTAPEKLATPDAPTWVAGKTGTVSFTLPQNAGGYYLVLYRDGKKCSGRVVYSYKAKTTVDLSGQIKDTGTYTAKVQALSGNLDQNSNSELSAASVAYDATGTGSAVKTDVDSAASSVSSASDAGAASKAVDDLTAKDDASALQVAMQTDSNVRDSVSALESAYKSKMGITVDKTVSSEFDDVLPGAVNKITLIGAALNATSANAQLHFNIQKPSTEIGINQASYHNVVQCNISLDGVTGDLRVPVCITMPIPVGVIPERMVILHYLEGSTTNYEIIRPLVTNNEYATFVLKRFSDFVFANTATSFTDLKENAWYISAVSFVFEKGLMTGTSSTTFAPNANITRGQFATILYRMNGSPSVTKTAPFTDLVSGKYYVTPVTWAYANGIIAGYRNSDGTCTKFGPENNITREQMAAIMYRYAVFKGYDTTSTTDISGFPDVSQVSGFSQTPFKWAVANSIISGKKISGTSYLSPKGKATRAECAAIIMRFINKFGQ
jgi:hypothetical protein